VNPGSPTPPHASLLLTGVLFSVGMGFLALGFSLTVGSFLGMVLALEFALVSAVAWLVHGVQWKRHQPTAPAPTDGPIPEAEQKSAVERLAEAVQRQQFMLASLAGLVAILAVIQLLKQALGGQSLPETGLGFGGVCIAAAILSQVLARAFRAVPAEELPESRALSQTFREAQWAALLAGAGFFATPLLPPLALWIGRAMLVWILALTAEILVRVGVSLLVPADRARAPVAPVGSLLRESLFTSGNPVGSLIRIVEARWGVSLRSSWAIVFVKRTAAPLAALLILLMLGLSSLSIVEMNQLGVREHFGRVSGGPLQPGLHVSLPWPLGRIRQFPVKTVNTIPIGFVEAEARPGQEKAPRALLWTRPHGKEEFALVLGTGSELVSVNALVYYKIDEDPEHFLEYVYHTQNPEEALAALAYRALTEETRSQTLDRVLGANQSEFSGRLLRSLRRQAAESRLGIEVIDVALINLHPPIEAAPSYLDVINARLDARRVVTEAAGLALSQRHRTEARGATAVATARAEGARRVAGAIGESSQFAALEQAYSVSPDALQLRLWIEAQEQALTGQRLFLVDQTLLGESGEIMLDLRRLPAGLPPPRVPAPVPAPTRPPGRD
jgi:regulator of protease activity HflC (stomatin/prohibitin superfamily)